MWFHPLSTPVMTFPTIQLKRLMSEDAELHPFCQHLPGKYLRPSAELHCRRGQVPTQCTNKGHQQGPRQWPGGA